jgi:hypothetical protein
MRGGNAENPRPMIWRWIAGSLLLLGAALWLSATVDNDPAQSDTFAPACALMLTGFVAGSIIRRPEAVVLGLIPVLIALPFGVQDFPASSIDPYFYDLDRVVNVIAPLALVCAAFITAGVLLAVLVQFIRRRARLPLPD